MKHTLLAALGILAATGCSTGALAAPVTVDATGEIYSAGQATAQYRGSLPTVVNLSSGTASLTFSGVQGSISCTSSAGCITMDNGGHYNDADGTGGASTLNGTGTTSLSGITAPGAGWLVGVLVASGGPSGSAPTALDFTTGSGTSFTSLSPQLDQVFFIGDGLTGEAPERRRPSMCRQARQRSISALPMPAATAVLPAATTTIRVLIRSR